jgi:hypothetical protein
MRVRAFSLFLLLAGAAACGSDTPTDPTPPLTTSTQFFSNSLAPGGSAVNTFALSSQNVINVTLASLVSAATGEPVDGATVVLGLGTPSGATCTTSASQTVNPQLAAQIRSSQPTGSYCISIADAGSIGESVVYTARVTLTSITPPESAFNFTESFSSALPLGGTVIHTFQAIRGGNSSVTLSVARTDQVLRMGLGLWDGSECRLTVSADTPAGATPQLVAGLDAGTYCVKLRDHTPTHQTGFTLTISHP